MNREEATRKACAIFGLVFHTVEDYDYANDGICDECRPIGSYRNDGRILEYVRRAVVKQLRADGYVVGPSKKDDDDGTTSARSPYVKGPLKFRRKGKR